MIFVINKNIMLWKYYCFKYIVHNIRNQVLSNEKIVTKHTNTCLDKENFTIYISF